MLNIVSLPYLHIYAVFPLSVYVGVFVSGWSLDPYMGTVYVPNCIRESGGHINIIGDGWQLISIKNMHLKGQQCNHNDILFGYHVTEVGRDCIIVWESNICLFVHPSSIICLSVDFSHKKKIY